MRYGFFSASRPLVFAHRGGAALAPENTIAAFDNGLALGADGIELDVRLSADNSVVVHHDATLDRTTNLRGPLARLSAAELRRADVPSLAEVLARYPEARVIIEMKLNAAAFARQVIDVVKADRAEERVCLGGFGRTALRAARLMAPEIATSAAREEVRLALYRSWCRIPARHAPYQGYQIPELAGRTRVASPRFVADAHRAGLAVQVWTVNEEEQARRLLEWGVDALITDRPDLMMRIVEGRRAASQTDQIMKQLPESVAHFKRTADFTQDTIPAGLLRDHRTADGVWGKIVVLEGSLRYRLLEPVLQEIILGPELSGVVEPTVRHEVQPSGPVRFYVEFYR